MEACKIMKDPNENCLKFWIWLDALQNGSLTARVEWNLPDILVEVVVPFSNLLWLEQAYLIMLHFLVLVWLSAVVVRAKKQSNVTVSNFKYRSYGEIVNYVEELKVKYPEYLEVYTAQERFGVTGGEEYLKCDRDGKKEPCQQYILHITDRSTLPDQDRPEVFFSGALHGDERVGPIAVTELAAVLLDHASRSDGSAWIKQLVATRSIFIMPTTNAHGFNRNSRTENGVDPNRDFPYLKTGSGCMNTITARSVNELWRRHAFQLAITFHGGMRAVSYEWGSTNHFASKSWGKTTSEKSPDHNGQALLSEAMSKYGGAFTDSRYYPHGPMNDIVYGVEGGMEDWGYAASWENEVTASGKPKPINTCDPTTYGGYPRDRTVYNKASHRSFNILVETSNSKNPSERSLGNDESLSKENLGKYLPSSFKVGHVARNVRLSLLYIDLVQPYINWIKLGSQGALLGMPVEFTWEVLGAFTVDMTVLEISRTMNFKNAKRYKVQSGSTRWRHDAEDSFQGKFTEYVSFDKTGKYYARAITTVDQVY